VNIIHKFDILLISKFLKLVANFRASRAIITNYFNPWQNRTELLIGFRMNRMDSSMQTSILCLKLIINILTQFLYLTQKYIII